MALELKTDTGITDYESDALTTVPLKNQIPYTESQIYINAVLHLITIVDFF